MYRCIFVEKEIKATKVTTKHSYLERASSAGSASPCCSNSPRRHVPVMPGGATCACTCTCAHVHVHAHAHVHVVRYTLADSTCLLLYYPCTMSSNFLVAFNILLRAPQPTQQAQALPGAAEARWQDGVPGQLRHSRGGGAVHRAYMSSRGRQRGRRRQSERCRRRHD